MNEVFLVFFFFFLNFEKDILTVKELVKKCREKKASGKVNSLFRSCKCTDNDC